MKYQFIGSSYTLEQVKDDFWLLARMYYNELYMIAFEIVQDIETAKSVLFEAFFTLSMATIQNYKCLEEIRIRLKELVIFHAKRLNKIKTNILKVA